MGSSCSTELDLNIALKIGLSKDGNVLGIMYYKSAEKRFLFHEISLMPGDTYHKQTEINVDKFNTFGVTSIYDGNVSELEKELTRFDHKTSQHGFTSLTEILQVSANLQLNESTAKKINERMPPKSTEK